MTDIELIESELRRMIPRTQTAPDWSDVVRRSRRRRVPSRALVLAAAFAAAAILTAVGYAVVQKVVVRDPHPFPKATGPAHTVAVIRTLRTHKPIILRVWPGPGGRGVTLISPGGTSKSCCAPVPAPRTIGVSAEQIGRIDSPQAQGMLVLWGPLGAAITTLELRFEDGKHVTLPIREGFVLYQVHPANFVDGRRPVGLVARDVSGQVVASRRVKR